MVDYLTIDAKILFITLIKKTHVYVLVHLNKTINVSFDFTSTKLKVLFFSKNNIPINGLPILSL